MATSPTNDTQTDDPIDAQPADAIDAQSAKVAADAPKDERIAPPVAAVAAGAAAADADADAEPALRATKKRAIGLAGAAVALCAVLVIGGIWSGLLSKEDAELADEQFMSATSGAQSQSATATLSNAAQADRNAASDEAATTSDAPAPDQSAENADDSADQGEALTEDSAPDNASGESADNAATGEEPPATSQPETQPDSGTAGRDDAPQAGSQTPTQTPSASSSPEQPSTPQPETPAEQPEKPATITVSVSTDSSRAVEYGYAASMGGGTVTLNEGSSVYDALCATGVAVGGSSGYVTSIGGLAEFACGATSGWLYFVNGVSPSVGCGSYVLKNGDSVTWIYTLDLGNDL